jgi:hypothetical protein
MQGEAVRAQTEIVANNNHAHALTIQYFQVLRHFLVRQRLADVRECLLIPMEITPFDPAKVLRWRGPLRAGLLSQEASIVQGFAALERMSEDYKHDPDFVDGMMADEFVEMIEGDMQIAFLIKRPQDKTPEEAYLEAIAQAEQEAKDEAEYKAKLDRLVALRGMYLPANWLWYNLLIAENNASDYWKNNLENEIDRDKIFHETLAPTLVEKLLAKMTFGAVSSHENKTHYVKLPLTATLVDAYQQGHSSLRVSLRFSGGTFDGLRRSDIEYIQVNCAYDETMFRDMLPVGSKVIIKRCYLSYKTANLSSSLVSNNDIAYDIAGSHPLRLYTPLKNFEKRQPRVQDRRNATRLLVHLNENVEYYSLVQ